MAKKKTLKEFIDESVKLHKGKYDYSLVKYVNNNTNVEIICKEHGVFEQRPNSHLASKGCPKCAGTEKLTNDLFIFKATRIHKNRYDYSLTQYVNSQTKVKILCEHHGVFEQTPNNHLAKHGCPKCGGTHEKTTECFIKESSIAHGERYDYSLVNYSKATSKVKIICKKHGVFLQKAYNHLMGQGCSKCAKTGFDTLSEGYVYFLISESGKHIKVGITNKLKQRLTRLSKCTPFSFSVIKYYQLDGETCRFLETYYHKSYASAGLKGFDGCTEWLKYSKELMSEIMGA